MRKLKPLLNNINLINIALTGVLVFLVNYVALPFVNMGGVRYTLPAVKKVSAENKGTAEKPAEPKSPSPSDYVIIAEQNLFHPERKIPVEKPPAPPPPPVPEFVLYGTLVTDDVNIAYMEDRKAAGVGNPAGREKKQIALKLGESMSGFTLKEIDRDKVVMRRGEETIVVSLNDPSKPKTREGAAPAPSAPPFAGFQATPGVRPPAPLPPAQHPGQPSTSSAPGRVGNVPAQQPTSTPSPGRRRGMFGSQQSQNR